MAKHPRGRGPARRPKPTAPKSWVYVDPHPSDQFRVPVHTGYAVGIPDSSAAQKAWNAYFELPNGERAYMWLTDLAADFAMAGSFAQGPRSRTWWPRNFTDPTFALTGQCANQQEYQKLAEFVRGAQLFALRDIQHPMVKLVIPGGGTDVPGGPKGVPKLKGRRRDWDVSGYIERIERRTERFVFAPTFNIAFVIESARQGILGSITQVQHATQLSVWTQILPAGEASEMVADPTKDRAKLHQQQREKAAKQKMTQTITELTDFTQNLL